MTDARVASRPLTVGDVMTPTPVTVDGRASFHQMATLMQAHGVSGLPVLDGHGRLTGIVSEADLLLREAPPAEPSPNRLWPESQECRMDRAKSQGTCAAEVMTRSVITVTPQSSLSAAARLMREHAVRRLPVVDQQGTLIGIASRRDLLTVFTRSDEVHAH